MAETRANQPLSPHLQIYRPLINMVMSIVHRMTGAALYAGSLLLAWWLIALAAGPEAFAQFQSAAGSIAGRAILFAFTWALMHHMLGGMRHMLWDTGRGFSLANIDRLSWATPITSVALTVALWAIGYAVR